MSQPNAPFATRAAFAERRRLSAAIGPMRSTRRRLLAFALAGLAAGPAVAQPSVVGDRRTFRNVMYIRAIPPMDLSAKAAAAKRGSDITNRVLEVSDAPPIRKCRDYLDFTVRREPDAMRRIDLINRYVNRHVKALPDKVLYLDNDLWAPPLNTLLIGGDCEDIALVKWWCLRRVGFDPNDLFLVAGTTRRAGHPSFHAVLIVFLRPDRGAILDNLTDVVHESSQDAQFEPRYALNARGYWVAARPPVTPAPAPAP